MTATAAPIKTLTLPKLYPAQKAAIFCAERYGIIEASTKSGKTAGCMAWILSKAWAGKPGQNYWWIAPVYSVAKIAFRRIKRMLGRADPHQSMWSYNQSELFITITNAGTIWFKGADDPDSLYGEDVHAAVIDEASRCFVAGTPIQTPDGFKPIELLRVGDTVCNAIGTGTIRRIIRKTSNSIAVVKVKGYTMVCSVDHRYLTQRGWVEAQHLGTTDTLISQCEAVQIMRQDVLAVAREAELGVLHAGLSVCRDQVADRGSDMSAMRQEFYSDDQQTTNEAFLRAELLREMENGTARNSGSGVYATANGKDETIASCVLATGHGADAANESCDGWSERDAHTQGARQNGRDNAGTWSPSACSRRQWIAVDETAGVDAGAVGRGLQGGTLCENWSGSHKGRTAAALHDRHSQPAKDAGGRDRRSLSRFTEASGVGRSQDRVPDSAWVESVEILESGSSRFLEYSGGKDTIDLYDLEVAGHPSFSVNGFVVHNCKEDAWHAVRSTLTATRGPIRIIGNVKGRKNWAYELARKAEGGEPNMRYSKLTAWDAVEGGVLTREEIEDAKRMLPENVFRELYLAEPADDGGNPFGLAAIRKCIMRAPAVAQPVSFGVDLAKSYDFTWAIGIDAQGREVVSERWQSDWGATRNRVLSVVNGWPTLIDSTGVGDPIVEDMQRIRPNITGFKFTAQSKQQIMEGLASAIQQGRVGFADKQLVNELEAFEYEYTRTGVRYTAPEGLHDDGVCFAAGTLIETINGPMPIELIQHGHKVLTRAGYKSVRATSNRMADVIEVDFSNGRRLIGTPDHPIICDNGMIVRLDSLALSDKLISCETTKQTLQRNQLYSTVSLSGDIQTRQDLRFADTFIRTLYTYATALVRFIEKFGSTTTGRFQKAITFITRTATPQTTPSPILSVYLQNSTVPFILQEETAAPWRFWNTYGAIVKSFKLDGLNGTHQKPQGFRESRTAKRHGLIAQLSQRHADIAAHNSQHETHEKHLCIVRHGAVNERGSQSKRAMVYNLSVADQPEYFANGILVHNCALALAVHHMAAAQRNTLELRVMDLGGSDERDFFGDDDE